MNIAAASASPAAVGASPTTWSGGSPAWGGPGSRGRMDAAVSATAQLVGLSLDAMKASLGDGRSLLDVASSRGVSAATVTSTIARAIAPAMGSGQGGLTAQVASRIASHHRA